MLKIRQYMGVTKTFEYFYDDYPDSCEWKWCRQKRDSSIFIDSEQL